MFASLPIPFSAPSFRSLRAPLTDSLRLLTPSLSRAARGVAPSNRRREIRRLARFGCRVRRMDNWRLVGDRTLDLSPEGLLVLSDERIDTGARLVVTFAATELPISFGAVAMVARIVEGRRPGDDGRALGLRLHPLPAVSRLILRGHLRKLPVMPAHREPPPELAEGEDQTRPTDYAQIVKDIWDGRR